MLFTLDRLQRRGLSLVNGCALYKEIESIGHFFLLHAKARILWLLVSSASDIPGDISPLVRDTLIRWHFFFVGRRHKKAWRVGA